MPVPVLKDIVRRHAEQAAHLWLVYDFHLRHPDDNPDMDAERLDRLIDRIDAHVDGVRVAGADGLTIAQERYDDFPEAGELFLLRMLQHSALHLTVRDLDPDAVRTYIAAHLPETGESPRG